MPQRAPAPFRPCVGCGQFTDQLDLVGRCAGCGPAEGGAIHAAPIIRSSAQRAGDGSGRVVIEQVAPVLRCSRCSQVTDGLDQRGRCTACVPRHEDDGDEAAVRAAAIAATPPPDGRLRQRLLAQFDTAPRGRSLRLVQLVNAIGIPAALVQRELTAMVRDGLLLAPGLGWFRLSEAQIAARRKEPEPPAASAPPEPAPEPAQPDPPPEPAVTVVAAAPEAEPEPAAEVEPAGDTALQYRPWTGSLADLTARIRDDPEAAARGMVRWAADKRALLQALDDARRALALQARPEDTPAPARAGALSLDALLEDSELALWFRLLCRAHGDSLVAGVRRAISDHVEANAELIEVDDPEYSAAEIAWMKAYRSWVEAAPYLRAAGVAAELHLDASTE